MTSSVQSFLTSFDSLPSSEQYQVAVEILRRTAVFDSGPLDDEALSYLTNELFLEYDREEAAHEGA